MKKIEEEVIHIYAIKYYTPEGKETCALDVKKKRMCPFLRTKNYGSCVCLFNQDAFMRTDENGFLIPVADCPVICNYIFIDDK